jgi:hypothetical protein
LFARNQEIYWPFALLAYDEPIRTLRGSVKMTGTQKPVRAIDLFRYITDAPAPMTSVA